MSLVEYPQHNNIIYYKNNIIVASRTLINDTRQEIRKTVIELVLATDMAQHVEIFNQFQNKRKTEGNNNKTNCITPTND